MTEDIEYKLLTDDRNDSLGKEVNKYLQSGWRLYGSPSCTSVIGHSGNIYWAFCQAVVRTNVDSPQMVEH